MTDSEDVTLLGFDACLMGMAEVAFEYRHGETGDGEFGAKYMVSSTATEQGDGWEYQKIFNRFSGSGSSFDSEGDSCYDVSALTGSDFAQIIVKEYSDAFSGNSGETMAAYDLDKIDEVKTALDNLASVLDDSADYKTGSETARDNAINFFDESDVDDWISYPHFDMWDYADNVGNEVSGGSSLADDLKTAVSSCVISSWGNGYPDYDYPDSTAEPYGLGFFYPDGDRIYTYYNEDPVTHYYTQWWYTAEDTNSWWSGGHYYGNLDFCSSDGDGNVEGWRELLEYWFDNGTDYTPSSY